MEEEEELVKDTKIILNQLEAIIIKRDQSVLEVCLWHTLESTLEILFIFTPKLIWYQQSNNTSFHDHLLTIVNASTLLSSVIKVILSKFKKDETTVIETLIAINRYTDVIQKMKYLVEQVSSGKMNYKLLIITRLHQLIRSLLFVFLTQEKQKKYNSYVMMTPPATPVSLTMEPLSSTSFQYQADVIYEEVEQQQDDTANFLSPPFDYYYQGVISQQKQTQLKPSSSSMITRAKRSEKIKSNHNDTVGKRFIRSISSLKKPHNYHHQHQNILETNNQARRKIDEERKLAAAAATTVPAIEGGYLKKNSTKSSIRIFFGSKRQPSISASSTNNNKPSSPTNNKHIKNIFENSIEVDHQSNKRTSVQTLASPYSRNISVRTTTDKKNLVVFNNNNDNQDLTSSDSGCFTATVSNIEDYYQVITRNHNNPMVTTKQQKSVASIQKEFAEPVFIKEQALRYNRSESDLRSISNILKPWGQSSNNNKEVKKKPSQLSLVGKLYNINEKNQRFCEDDDEEDNNYEILKRVKGKGKEGSILHISEDGKDVLVMEMVQSNKLQVMAGSLERLFMKLADETCQDLDYVDTYILSHLFFTDSLELLENLMARFHLEALPGEANYFKKWQRCIQVKVLNVISRWIKLQFQDFRMNPILITRLEAFLNGDVNRAGFTIEADMIKEALDRQRVQFSRSRHSLIVQTSQSLVSFGNSSSCSTIASNSHHPSYSSIVRRPSVTPSFLSFVSYTTPPDSPTYTPERFLSLNSKDVARYLTLADFYILKCITAQDYLAIYYPNNNHVKKRKKNSNKKKTDYIAMMTERANRLSKWVVEEIVVHKVNSKQRRIAIRKMIEIAKLCLNWNNFHTCMVITMGLTQLQEFRDNSWQQVSLLPNRDILTLKQLLKYLNVCNNMSYYRQAFKKAAKAPCIPFFPIVLKDLTFLMDGNATINVDGLVNFTKFRILCQSIHSVLNYTIENYYFASELEYFPFFPKQPLYSPQLHSNGNTLDQVAATLEAQIQNCSIADPCEHQK